MTGFDDEIIVETGDPQDGGPAWWVWVLIALGISAVIALLVWAITVNSEEPEVEPSPTVSASVTPSPSPSPTPSVTPSETPEPTPSETEEPDPKPTETDEPDPKPTETDEPDPKPTETEEPEPEPTDTAAPAPPSEFGEGVVKVGTDAAPGTYRTTKAVESGKCGWLLQGVKAGDPAHNLNPDILVGGIPTVTLVEGDIFASRGCGTWAAVDPEALFATPDATPAKLTDGVWLVGEDVRPGTYQTKEQNSEANPLKSCRWTITESLKTNFTDVIVREYAITGVGKVAIASGQQIESTNCGDWVALTK